MLLPNRSRRFSIEEVEKEVIKSLKKKYSEKILLNEKIDEYLEWFNRNYVEGQINELYEGQIVDQLNNLIDKVAVWYELKYPDYRVNRLIPYEKLDNHKSYNINNNNKMYNFKHFVECLPDNEKYYFKDLGYQNIMYFNPDKFAHLHVSNTGTVLEAEGIRSVSKSLIDDDELEGMNVGDVVNIFKERGIELPAGNEIEPAVLRNALWNNHKNGLFDSIMYKIMERGGEIVGPRRAMLFAQEFGRDISTPMKYGVNFNDQGMNNLMAYYLVHGGDRDLECYFDYYNSAREDAKFDLVTFDQATVMFSNLDRSLDKHVGNKVFIKNNKN